MVSRKESWLGLNLRMKILVVDDNQEITDVLSVFCESQEIEVEAINDSKKVLPAIRKHDFDLMLLDIAMPEFTGLDIINSLKNDGLLDKMNVVVFTASSDNKLHEEIRKSGVREILQKPCGINDLEELIVRYKK